jgi:hypothetical protein
MGQLKLGVEEARPSTARTAQYGISVSCNKCAGMHETGISIAMEDGPIDKQSIGDFYGEKSLPKSLATLSQESFSCPVTGRQSIQKDARQIFLIPIKARPTNEHSR